jgi:hypothetical protein
MIIVMPPYLDTRMEETIDDIVVKTVKETRFTFV